MNGFLAYSVASRQCIQRIMERTLGEHLEGLRMRLEVLNFDLLTPGRDPAETAVINEEIRLIRLALSHYEAAIQIEKDIKSVTRN